MHSIALNNDTTMPLIGFGTWQVPDGEPVITAVKSALQSGYRLIDTAMIYNNERGVGEGIRASGVAREEVFVTTKLWSDDQGYENTLKAFDESLKRLGLEYVDLYLMHWPFAKRAESWRAMEEIYASGRVRAIGVSNFLERHFNTIFESGSVVPAVNQIEFHPFLYDQLENLLEYCIDKQIAVEAYSPLAHAAGLDNDIVTSIGKRYGKTSAQILLRWAIEKGAVPIPKSTKAERIRENYAVFDFELEPQDVAALDNLGRNLRICADPNELD